MAELNKRNLKRRLSNALDKYFEDDLGYDKNEIPRLNLYRIDFEYDKADNYWDVYLYAEISMDEFFDLQPKLNSIVESIDESAYWDVQQPGVFMCRIYQEYIADNSTKYEISQKDLTNFANSICYHMEEYVLPDEGYEGEEFWADSIELHDNYLKISFESVHGFEATIEVDIEAGAWRVVAGFRPSQTI